MISQWFHEPRGAEETLEALSSFSPSFLPPSKVICYGAPVADAAQLAGLRAPVCGVYGANDAQFPPPLLNAFRGALEAAEVRARVVPRDRSSRG